MEDEKKLRLGYLSISKKKKSYLSKLNYCKLLCTYQRWSRGHKAKDTKKFRGQGHGPRTQTQVFSKKKVLQKFFQMISKKKGLQKFFQVKKVFKKFFSGDLYLKKPKKRSLVIFHKVSGIFQQNFNGSKIVLSSS